VLGDATRACPKSAAAVSSEKPRSPARVHGQGPSASAVTGSPPIDTASSFFGREPTDERTAWPAFSRAILDDELNGPANFKTLKRFSFVKVFPTDLRKINNLVLTVDQEVGGSNPPSCTSKINRLGKRGRVCSKSFFRHTLFCAGIIVEFIQGFSDTVLQNQ
jgi:hypothetical protein